MKKCLQKEQSITETMKQLQLLQGCFFASGRSCKSSILLKPFFFPSPRRENIFSAKRREENCLLERGWILWDHGEFARIHYLSVLYLFHMLLLPNLSLQILDLENKQMDQLCCLLPMHLQTAQRCNAAVLPSGWKKKFRWRYKVRGFPVYGCDGQIKDTDTRESCFP